MLILPKLKLIFIHIPKTGGSSLNSYILQSLHQMFSICISTNHIYI